MLAFYLSHSKRNNFPNAFFNTDTKPGRLSESIVISFANYFIITKSELIANK